MCVLERPLQLRQVTAHRPELTSDLTSEGSPFTVALSSFGDLPGDNISQPERGLCLERLDRPCSIQHQPARAQIRNSYAAVCDRECTQQTQIEKIQNC